MADFLSQAWIDAAHAAVAEAGLSAPDGLVIQQLITRQDGSTIGYHVDLDADGARVAGGEHPQPTVIYRMGYDIAGGIATGELDPYAEFMAGRLEISGDSSALVANQGLIEQLQAALAGAAEE